MALSCLCGCRSLYIIIRYGAQESARLIFRSAQEQSVPVGDLADYITSLSEKADARAREIDHVVLGFPSPFCRNGVRLVDTPGLNSMHEVHERATMEYLPRGSAGIMAIINAHLLFAYKIKSAERVQDFHRMIENLSYISYKLY